MTTVDGEPEPTVAVVALSRRRVAVVAFLLVPAAGAALLPGWASSRAEPGGQVQVVAVTASAGAVVPGSLPEPSAFRFTLHNAGELVARVSGMTLTVQEHAWLQVCGDTVGFPAGAASYAAMLPLAPAPAQLVALDGVHLLPGHASEEVEVALQVPSAAEGGVHVYQLVVAMEADGRPLPSPPTVVVVPVPTGLDGYVDRQHLADEGRTGECYRSNLAEVDRVATWLGTRPAHLLDGAPARSLSREAGAHD